MANNLLKKLRDFNKNYFSISNLEKISGLEKDSLLVSLSRLEKRGEIERIGQGIYKLPDAAVDIQKIATETYSPAYISFESAFSYYGILSQAPYDLFLATTNRSKKTEIAGQEIIYRKIKKELFFGYDLIDEIYIAKKEKSLLDILYFFDKGIIMLDLKSLDLKSINKKILSKYAQKFPERIQKTAKKLLQDYEN